jgi:type III pantothenate kinase
MLLLVDAGNSRIKWALADGDSRAALGRWHGSGSVAREQAGELAQAWSGLAVERVLLSNVAGTAVRATLEQVLQSVAPGVAPQWIGSQPQLAGVKNGYRQPLQLGSDRFISAIGAHALYPEQPLLVVTCGTATTIDAIATDGLFHGGLILPGLSLMAASLARNTAQLPQVAHQIGHQIVQPDEKLPLFADNTEEAIISGCMAAQTGAIEHAFADFSHRYAGETVLCLLSGGAGASVGRHLAIPHRHVDNLVLPGLQTVAYLSMPH